MKTKGFVLKILIFLVIFVFLKAGNSVAQDSDQPDILRVFIDCSDCDMEYLKQKITFVEYVHDRKDSELHILETHRSSGGGQEYQLQFIGLGRNMEQNHTLTFTSSSTDTTEELRRRFLDNLVFGLMPYIAETKIAEEIKVTYPETNKTVSGKVDPWNSWVFSISASGMLIGEEKSNVRDVYSSISAGRVTEEWNIHMSARSIYRKTNYVLPDESTITSTQKSHSASGYAVKSLGEHWGIGSGATLQRDRSYNLNQSYKLALAGEYNFFPYKQSSDRIFTLTYTAGFADINYMEPTIFGKLNERLFTQGFNASFSKKSQWGDSGLSGQYSHLGNLRTMRLELDGSVSWRITRGLSLDISGRTRFIRDQLYLSGSGLTLEEILLEQKVQATGFDYYFRTGFTFRFGSIYNSIVNSRLSGTSFGIF